MTAAVSLAKLGNNPVLCVQSNNSPALSAATWTTVPFNTVSIDTHSFWNPSTYIYTPTIAGYYLCTFNALALTGGGYLVAAVNNSRTGGEYGTIGWSGSTYNQSTSTVIYCNGTTDGIKASVFSNNNNSLSPYAWQNTLNIVLIKSA